MQPEHPRRTTEALENVTAHMQPTKQRRPLVLPSVRRSVHIIVNVELRVLSKCFSYKSHPRDLPITRICVFKEIPFWGEHKKGHFISAL